MQITDLPGFVTGYSISILRVRFNSESGLRLMQELMTGFVTERLLEERRGAEEASILVELSGKV